MKWIETITPKQAAEELGVPYHGWMREMDRAWISEDQKYSVMSRLLRTEWGKVEHVTITAAEGVGQSDGSGDAVQYGGGQPNAQQQPEIEGQSDAQQENNRPQPARPARAGTEQTRGILAGSHVRNLLSPS